MRTNRKWKAQTFGEEARPRTTLEGESERRLAGGERLVGIQSPNPNPKPKPPKIQSQTQKSKNLGAALFFDPEMSFSRPRDWSILFSAAACLFYDLQLFFSPAMRPRKKPQSFFQPLCIILSSLFLGPETSCSEPRIFFRTPRHLFLDLRCLFSTSAGETHTQGEMRSKSQIRNSQIRKQKPSKGK